MDNYDLMLSDILDRKKIHDLFTRRKQEAGASKTTYRLWADDFQHAADQAEREGMEIAAAMAAYIIRDAGAGDLETLAADIYNDPKKFLWRK